MLPRLGVNIDHLATLRQLRGTVFPNLVEATKAAKRGGASQITIHLREDRRHIQDADVFELIKKSVLPINLEMSTHPSVVKVALKAKPKWVCLVPEKRKEVTTEGGLNLKRDYKKIKSVVSSLLRQKIKVSLFLEAKLEWVEITKSLGAHAIEIHTGDYCNAKDRRKELAKIRDMAKACAAAGILPNAGHGIDYENILPLVQLDPMGLLQEYNIGHSIVCRSTEVGFEAAVREMVSLITAP